VHRRLEQGLGTQHRPAAQQRHATLAAALTPTTLAAALTPTPTLAAALTPTTTLAAAALTIAVQRGYVTHLKAPGRVG
jgi:hypothetical protein